MAPHHLLHIIVAHAQPMFCRGFIDSFARTKGIREIINACTAAALFSLLAQQTSHILYLDDELPQTSLIPSVQIIKARHPGLKIIVLTMNQQQHYLRQLLNAGVHGIICKTTLGKEIKDAIPVVMNGKKYCCPVTQNLLLQNDMPHTNGMPANDITTEMPHFPPRLQQVLTLMLQNKTSLEISSGLQLQLQTVKGYRKEVRKLLKTAGLIHILDKKIGL
jgi:DNA-binding NarL/FixJ family response regulator